MTSASPQTLHTFRDKDGVLIDVLLPQGVTPDNLQSTMSPGDTIEFCPQGGGRVSHMKVADFVKTFQIVKERPGMQPMFVSGDWMDGDEKHAAYATGLRWNGWQQPWFEFDVAMKIAEGQDDLKYDAEKDAFVQTQDWGEEEPVVDVFKGEFFEIEGRGPVKLYPVGAGYWCWVEVGGSDSDRNATHRDSSSR